MVNLAYLTSSRFTVGGGECSGDVCEPLSKQGRLRQEDLSYLWAATFSGLEVLNSIKKRKRAELQHPSLSASSLWKSCDHAQAPTSGSSPTDADCVLKLPADVNPASLPPLSSFCQCLVDMVRKVASTMYTME